MTGDDLQTQIIINFSALPCLLALLGNPKKGIRKEACWTISNITAGNKDQIQSVVDANVIPPLVNLLNSAEFDIRKEAAWAISNATSGGTPEQIKFLVSQACIPPLCELLSVADVKIIIVALDALENILKVGDAESKQMGGHNLMANHIADSEGLKKIEDLQQHDNNDDLREGRAGLARRILVLMKRTSTWRRRRSATTSRLGWRRTRRGARLRLRAGHVEFHGGPMVVCDDGFRRRRLWWFRWFYERRRRSRASRSRVPRRCDGEFPRRRCKPEPRSPCTLQYDGSSFGRRLPVAGMVISSPSAMRRAPRRRTRRRRRGLPRPRRRGATACNPVALGTRRYSFRCASDHTISSRSHTRRRREAPSL